MSIYELSPPLKKPTKVKVCRSSLFELRQQPTEASRDVEAHSWSAGTGLREVDDDLLDALQNSDASQTNAGV